MYSIRKCSSFILLHIAVRFSWHHLLKSLSFLHCIFTPPLSKIRCMGLLWAFCLVPLVYISVFVPVPYSLNENCSLKPINFVSHTQLEHFREYTIAFKCSQNSWTKRWKIFGNFCQQPGLTCEADMFGFGLGQPSDWVPSLPSLILQQACSCGSIKSE